VSPQNVCAELEKSHRPLIERPARPDLYALISLLLGELNSSHLRIVGKLPTPNEPTADLGLLFDETHRGPGMKIADVLKRGPADKRGLGLRAERHRHGRALLGVPKAFPVAGPARLAGPTLAPRFA